MFLIPGKANVLVMTESLTGYLVVLGDKQELFLVRSNYLFLPHVCSVFCFSSSSAYFPISLTYQKAVS